MAGCAPIKPEYIDTNHKPKLAEEFLPKKIAEQLKEPAKGNNSKDTEGADGAQEPSHKRPKLKGRNKKRPIEKNPDAKDKICPQILAEKECPFGERCRFMHDVDQYLSMRPPDLGDSCYNYQTFGCCPYSFACRFASTHLTTEHKNKINTELYERKKDRKTVLNALDKDLQRLLWKRKYDFSRCDEICNQVRKELDSKKPQTQKDKPSDTGAASSNAMPGRNQTAGELTDGMQSVAEDLDNVVLPSAVSGSDHEITKSPELSAVDNFTRNSSEVIKSLSRDCGKKTIDFRDKLYLAPLTTVGNLPFRRVCKILGADITCSEMVMCQNLLQGQQSEWALLKRHVSEDIFGIQLCGSYADIMTRCAHMICENLNADFIDINCGCPIDLVFKKGEGSALMGRTARFEHIARSMSSVMNIPLTAKIRTGIYENKNIAHTLVPSLRDWGISLTTLHGRSREQRYTRSADWEYINTCAQAASPMSLFGNGDILSFEDYEAHQEHTKVSGAMIARGALMKPWIFTEIKERRHWDISASERLELLRDFTNFGLEHWGSDQQGVTTTRRFLLEWLSFLYRYIPVGLLERLPQKINEKPPHYFGRDDLETLMASPNCADWIKISEMLLGPVPQNFAFLPKHKANSYN